MKPDKTPKKNRKHDEHKIIPNPSISDFLGYVNMGLKNSTKLPVG